METLRDRDALVSSDTHYRNCHLCEAVCGLEIQTADGQVLSVRGDAQDPFSRGHICPKGVAIGDMHEDPDRLRKPLQRTHSGWRELDWDDALDYAAEGLAEVQRRHGDDAVADFIGNASGCNYGLNTHLGYLRGALNSRNRASLASIDHISHLLVSSMMYGHQFLLPIPDIDRTQYMVVAGANPLASNGSLMTAPGVRDRLKAIGERGGKVVVIDPRRTQSAKFADEHYFIRPGTDAALAAAVLNTLFDEGLTNLRDLSPIVSGLDTVAEQLSTFSPERMAAITGIDAGAIRQLARDFAGAERAVWYSRIGTCAQVFGATTQWLFSLINIATGNLDRPGGFMLNTPAVDLAADPNIDPGQYDEWRTRVRELPSFGGEVPAASLADEMLSEGEGQIRGFVSIAANPVLTFPNGPKLDRALASLEFMVSLDPYVTATSRHADVILPAPGPLHSDHYELIFHSFAVRNVAKYVDPVFPIEDDSLLDWQILVGLGERIAKRKGLEFPPVISPSEMIDSALQNGAYGKAAGHPAELDLEKLRASPHGIDLGALEPRFPGCLQTEDRRIHCAPPVFLEDLKRLERSFSEVQPSNTLLLIGRRHLRSKNSQTQNCAPLMRGSNLCTLFMHPDDLSANGLVDGQMVEVRSKTGDVRLPVEATSNISPGVVSMPHGFDHGREGVRLSVASKFPAASVNDLTDDARIDAVTGMPGYNGVPVTVGPAEAKM